MRSVLIFQSTVFEVIGIPQSNTAENVTIFFITLAYHFQKNLNTNQHLSLKLYPFFSFQALWLKKEPMNLSVLCLGVSDVLVGRNLESTPMLPTTMIGSTRIVTIVQTKVQTILFSSIVLSLLNDGGKLNGLDLRRSQEFEMPCLL